MQTSAMDCGPAALKCLLEGFGISVSYGRLREACQTDVDGTSIDTMEEIAAQLGLDAEQVMLPVDHVLLPEAQALPAIVVVRLPTGVTHFVVAWRRHGRFVQVMDPATGRRWPTCGRFLDEIYVHSNLVSAAGWRAWAGSDGFLGPLGRRLKNLGVGPRTTAQLFDRGLADPGWRGLAALDATARMLDAIVRSRALRRGRHTVGVLEMFLERAREEVTDDTPTIPAVYWSVRMAPPSQDGDEQLELRGAVLVCVRGRNRLDPILRAGAEMETAAGSAPLSPELLAALEEPPRRPGRELVGLLRADGLLAPSALAAAIAIAAAGVIVEAVLFRGFFDLGRELRLSGQRLGAVGVLLAFVAGLLLLELPIAAGVLRLGRRIEARLRIAFLEKIPRLADRYFRSRLTSDMAERSHSIHGLRLVPDLGARLIRSAFELTLTTAGIAWLDPASAPLAIFAAALTIALPAVAQPLLRERDLRVRNHLGALSRYYLDALLGLVAVRAHGAERAVRREHERLVVEWARAGLGLQRAVVSVEALQSLAGFGIAAWLVFDHLARGAEAGRVLLLVYWALNLPVLGQEVAVLARQYPTHRNLTLRLLEPLGAPEQTDTENVGQALAPASSTRVAVVSPPRGVAVAIEGVRVRAAGHTILEGIDLAVEAGTHVAIVGRSGAGKSSLVGILLGWHRPATGRVVVDGEPLDGKSLERLRRVTAWVDPTVQLWNRSFLENLLYGSSSGPSLPFGLVIEAADLRDVLERLPGGLQTTLGEGGALVSGGEGQRVRLGRAMLRSGVRLVILDEPFRGLDRERRRELLARARRLWREATLLCITHDVGETLAFDRVVVVEDGRVVEAEAPRALASRAASRYRAMLEAEVAVRETVWSGGPWRRLWLEGGRLIENARKVET